MKGGSTIIAVNSCLGQPIIAPERSTMRGREIRKIWQQPAMDQVTVQQHIQAASPLMNKDIWRYHGVATHWHERCRWHADCRKTIGSPHPCAAWKPSGSCSDPRSQVSRSQWQPGGTPDQAAPGPRAGGTKCLACPLQRNSLPYCLPTAMLLPCLQKLMHVCVSFSLFTCEEISYGPICASSRISADL